MCGRYNLRTTASEFAEFFAVHVAPEQEPLLLRYNIAPTQDVLAVRMGPEGRETAALRWGLIPSWADDPKIGNRMINARADGVASKPSFRAAFKRRRCLIPASGFYEWQARDRRKQPFHIAPDGGGLMAFAGLWEHWARNGELPIESCTIITTDANRALSSLHDRMPVILTPAEYDDWLAESTPRDRLERLLRPAPEDFLDFVPVSTAVNNVRHTGPDCVTPLSQAP